MVTRGRSIQGKYLYWSALITLPREGLKKTGPKITGALVVMHGKVKRNDWGINHRAEVKEPLLLLGE